MSKGRVEVRLSMEKSRDSNIGSAMRVLGDTSVGFIEQSSILNRKIGVNGRSEFFPKNEQGGGEWAVLKKIRMFKRIPHRPKAYT